MVLSMMCHILLLHKEIVNRPEKEKVCLVGGTKVGGQMTCFHALDCKDEEGKHFIDLGARATWFFAHLNFVQLATSIQFLEKAVEEHLEAANSFALSIPLCLSK